MWPARNGAIGMKATHYSSLHTKVPGISPSMILVNTVAMNVEDIAARGFQQRGGSTMQQVTTARCRNSHRQARAVVQNARFL